MICEGWREDATGGEEVGGGASKYEQINVTINNLSDTLPVFTQQQRDVMRKRNSCEV